MLPGVTKPNDFIPAAIALCLVLTRLYTIGALDEVKIKVKKKIF